MNRRRNKLEYVKVPQDTVKHPLEVEEYIKRMDEDIRKDFENILSKPIRCVKDAFDNIVEMQEFLAHSHDCIPDARRKVDEKLYAIQQHMGKEVLERGMEIYDYYKANKNRYDTMRLEDRIRIEQEIISTPRIAEQLNNLHYNPQLARKPGTGSYEAVYAKMLEREMGNRRDMELNEREE